MFKKMMTLAILILPLTFLEAAEIDTANSTFVWKASKKIGGGHTGTIKLQSAKGQFSKEGKLTSGEFIIELANFDVTDLDGEYKQKFLGHVKGADFFQVEQYPIAKLVVTKVSKGQVEGQLTIKDKTNPVKFKFTEAEGKYTGKLVFDRTKYGVIYGSGNFFKELTADKVISNDVELDFNLVVKK